MEAICKKFAFTLAEVLITIGIIGVVAAMTIPSIMSKCRKIVVTTRLKETSAILSSAYRLSINEYGDGSREGFTPLDPDAALEMFNKYYVPFMKFDRVVKGEKGVFGYLMNGTVIYLIKNAEPDSWANTYLVTCITHKACSNMKEPTSFQETKKLPNGKDIFTLYIDGTAPLYGAQNSTREQLIDECKNQTSIEACTALIYKDSWQISKDYPIKI